MRAYGISEQECLEHSPQWMGEQMEAIQKRRQDEFSSQHRQSFHDILIGVNLAVAAANGSEEAAERVNQILAELARPVDLQPDELKPEQMTDDEWLLNPQAKGYDLAALRGRLAGMGASVQSR